MSLYWVGCWLQRLVQTTGHFNHTFIISPKWAEWCLSIRLLTIDIILLAKRLLLVFLMGYSGISTNATFQHFLSTTNNGCIFVCQYWCLFSDCVGELSLLCAHMSGRPLWIWSTSVSKHNSIFLIKTMTKWLHLIWCRLLSCLGLEKSTHPDLNKNRIGYRPCMCSVEVASLALNI